MMISLNILPKTQAVFNDFKANGFDTKKVKIKIHLKKDRKMNNKKEKKKYEKKLSNLLDSLVYFKSAKDNKEYTPRHYFEGNFKLLVDAPFMYFKAIANTADNQVADEDLHYFIKYGGGFRGAYHLIKQEINTLDGTTVGFIKYGATLSHSAYQINEAIKQGY